MRRLLGLGLTLALISVAGIAAAATPEVVLNDPAVNEVGPSASDGYLVWSADSEARPNRTNSYVMATGGDPVRINPAGTQSYEAAIDGTTVVYQEASSDGADIWFYDVLTEERTPAPSGVNTAGWEFRPTLSGNWLLYTLLVQGLGQEGRAVQPDDRPADRAQGGAHPSALPRERPGEWRLGHIRVLPVHTGEVFQLPGVPLPDLDRGARESPEPGRAAVRGGSRPTARSISCARGTAITGCAGATRSSSAWMAATER